MINKFYSVTKAISKLLNVGYSIETLSRAFAYPPNLMIQLRETMLHELNKAMWTPYNNRNKIRGIKLDPVVDQIELGYLLDKVLTGEENSIRLRTLQQCASSFRTRYRKHSECVLLAEELLLNGHTLYEVALQTFLDSHELVDLATKADYDFNSLTYIGLVDANVLLVETPNLVSRHLLNQPNDLTDLPKPRGEASYQQMVNTVKLGLGLLTWDNLSRYCRVPIDVVYSIAWDKILSVLIDEVGLQMNYIEGREDITEFTPYPFSTDDSVSEFHCNARHYFERLYCKYTERSQVEKEDYLLNLGYSQTLAHYATNSNTEHMYYRLNPLEKVGAYNTTVCLTPTLLNLTFALNSNRLIAENRLMLPIPEIDLKSLLTDEDINIHIRRITTFLIPLEDIVNLMSFNTDTPPKTHVFYLESARAYSLNIEYLQKVLSPLLDYTYTRMKYSSIENQQEYALLCLTGGMPITLVRRLLRFNVNTLMSEYVNLIKSEATVYGDSLLTYTLAPCFIYKIKQE